MHKACPTVLCQTASASSLGFFRGVFAKHGCTKTSRHVLGLFIQFCDHLQEIHSRDTQGGAGGDTSQQARSCSGFPQKDPALEPLLDKDRARVPSSSPQEEQCQAATLCPMSSSTATFCFCKSRELFSKGDFTEHLPCSQLAHEVPLND